MGAWARWPDRGTCGGDGHPGECTRLWAHSSHKSCRAVVSVFWKIKQQQKQKRQPASSPQLGLVGRYSALQGACYWYVYVSGERRKKNSAAIVNPDFSQQHRLLTAVVMADVVCMYVQMWYGKLYSYCTWYSFTDIPGIYTGVLGARHDMRAYYSRKLRHWCMWCNTRILQWCQW